jgi:hypothetical protein
MDATAGQPQPRPGSLLSRTASAVAFSRTMEVLALDDVWTRHLSAPRSDESGDPEFDSLIELADRLDAALAALPEALESVRPVLEVVDEPLIHTFVEVIANDDPRARAALERLRADQPGELWRETLDGACQVIQDATAEEREILQGKRRLAESGELPDPDLRPGFRCGLSLVGVAAAATATILSGGAAGVVPLTLTGQATTLVVAWNGTGCPKAWESLRARYKRT